MYSKNIYGWTHIEFSGEPTSCPPKAKAAAKTHGASTNSDLPPCRVCSRRGTGLHYGVITCEACKGFFRRNNRAPHLLKCSKSGSCTIELYSGSACTKCRYQKCIDVGMSEKAIKKGRYTTQRRTKYILEVTKQKTLDSETKSHYPLIPNPELETLIQTLQIAHARHVPSLHYLSKSHLDELLWNGSACNLHGSFVELLKSDCATSDDDLKYIQIQRDIALDLEAKIHPYIMFLKSIPGFCSLSSVDQAQLLKYGCWEYLTLEAYPGINMDTGFFCSSIDKCFHRDDLIRQVGREFICDMFSFAYSLIRLELTTTELVLMEAICILSPDRCELEDQQTVESLQWQVVSSLLHLYKTTNPHSLSRFSKIMDRIAAMRVLSEQYYVIVKSIRNTWPTVQQNSLLTEIFDL